METKKIYQITISETQAGGRLDKTLSEHEAIQSRNKAHDLIKKDDVQVNGQIEKPSFKLQTGDVIEFSLPTETKDTGLVPYNIPLEIIYEDDDVIVINKPSGLVVHPSAGHEQDTLVNALIFHCKNLSMGFLENRPGIVHRIDKDTSGLLVIAKNDISHEQLAQQFKNKTTHRIYYALVIGHPKFKSKTITTYLKRHPKDRKKYASEPLENLTEPTGKKATTNVEVIQIFPSGLSLIKCQLETGRTHQIRVHLSELGFPIVGDGLYGGINRAKGLKSSALRSKIKTMNRFALHAAELGFTHPKTKETLTFHVPISENLHDLFPENFNFEELVKTK